MLEFLEQTKILDTELTLLSLLFGAIIMAAGITVAKVVKSLFFKYYAPKLPEHNAKNIGKLIYFGIIIVSFLAFTISFGIDLSGVFVAGGIFAIVIGFATQSVVSNLISGVFLMMEKPTKQGDTVELPSFNITGTVVDISTFSTRIRKFDGTIVRIPNDKVFTSDIRIITDSRIRRMEAKVGIAYGENIDNAISVIKNAIYEKLPHVLLDPELEFRVTNLADSSVEIDVFGWYPREDWGKVQPVVLKIIKNALNDAGIEIPFPHQVEIIKK